MSHYKHVHCKYHKIIVFLKYIPQKGVCFEIFLNWFKCTNYTLSDMIFFALLGTVNKCKKGTASAWEKNTTQSCVFYKQYIYSAYNGCYTLEGWPGKNPFWRPWLCTANKHSHRNRNRNKNRSMSKKYISFDTLDSGHLGRQNHRNKKL